MNLFERNVTDLKISPHYNGLNMYTTECKKQNKSNDRQQELGPAIPWCDTTLNKCLSSFHRIRSDRESVAILKRTIL
jgi:hypothetical protein